MTPQEQQMIDGLVDRIRNTPVQAKDTEAEQHIQQALGSYPDAQYVLVQTVLVQQYGLQQAQTQINELKQSNDLLQRKLSEAASQTKSSSGSFLSHIFGGGESSQAPPAPSSPSYQQVNNPGYSQQAYPQAAPPPPYPAQPYPQAYPQQGGGVFGGGGGGFLQGALQTAAGVAAGEVMFQGMENLFHGFGHGSERGFGSPGGETVVNNYYDDDRTRNFDSRDRDDSSFYNPEHDASRSDSTASEAAEERQGGDDIGNFGGNAMNFGNGNDGSNDLSFDSGDGGGAFDNNSGDDVSFDDSSSDFSGDNS